MKLFTKAALGALMLAGATAVSASPAAAHVTIGIGFGGGYGGYYEGGPRYYGPPQSAVCDRYSRYYDPYRCDRYGDNYGDYDNYDYYNGPVFIDGIWLNGGYRSRWYGGHREFYYNNGWHGGTGYHGGGFSHGGGGGGYHGGAGGGGYHGGGHWHH